MRVVPWCIRTTLFKRWEHQALNEQSEPTEVVSLYYGGALKMHPVFCPLGHEPMLSYDIRGVCVREGASGLTSPPDSTGSASVLHSCTEEVVYHGVFSSVVNGHSDIHN